MHLMCFYYSLFVGLVWGSCLGAKADILPPESFEEIKPRADLIGLLKIELIETASAGPVKAVVVERFKGEPARGTINIAWPPTGYPKQGEEYYLSPKVGEIFYVFLIKSETGVFSHVSAQWSFYRVREAPSGKDVRGYRIYHHDCYWEFDRDSATRVPYARQSEISRWPVEHVVKSGDSLWKLAQKYYGDQSRWRRISKGNPWISDPSKLKVGSKISIPNISDYD